MLIFLVLTLVAALTLVDLSLLWHRVPLSDYPRPLVYAWLITLALAALTAVSRRHPG